MSSAPWKKAGYLVRRQGKHIVMSNGGAIIVIARHNPVNAITLGAIIRHAGLTLEEFRKLL